MDKLSKFKAMHQQDDLFFLPNSWDVLSAVILEQTGFEAIGTTSWGVANSMGFSDGEKIPFEALLSSARKIVSAVNIPVTVDIESGFSHEVDDIVNNVLSIADIGAVGINIEDSLKAEPGLKDKNKQGALIEKIRQKLDCNGYKAFFINARIDTYLYLNNPLNETINRSLNYLASGADGVFVPGLHQSEEIKNLTNAIKAPLNIMSLPRLTETAHLSELGVKRFSIGNALSDATISFIEEKANTLLNKKDTSSLYNKSVRTEFNP